MTKNPDREGKVREFWIVPNADENQHPHAQIYFEPKFDIQNKANETRVEIGWIRVIEKSAYDAVVERWNNECNEFRTALDALQKERDAALESLCIKAKEWAHGFDSLRADIHNKYNPQLVALETENSKLRERIKELGG